MFKGLLKTLERRLSYMDKRESGDPSRMIDQDLAMAIAYLGHRLLKGLLFFYDGRRAFLSSSEYRTFRSQ